VVVVPLRVNVNLKAATVEDLIARRKACFSHHLSCTSPCLASQALPPFRLITQARR
jgi:hypothetical protein